MPQSRDTVFIVLASLWKYIGHRPLYDRRLYVYPYDQSNTLYYVSMWLVSYDTSHIISRLYVYPYYSSHVILRLYVDSHGDHGAMVTMIGWCPGTHCPRRASTRRARARPAHINTARCHAGLDHVSCRCNLTKVDRNARIKCHPSHRCVRFTGSADSSNRELYARLYHQSYLHG